MTKYQWACPACGDEFYTAYMMSECPTCGELDCELVDEVELTKEEEEI